MLGIQGPGSFVGQGAATVSVSAAEGGGGAIAYYECSINGGLFFNCGGSGVSATLRLDPPAAPSDGLSVEVRVRAVDVADNRSASLIASWRLDYAAPTTMGLTAVTPFTKDKLSASFVVQNPTDGTGSGITSYICALDNGPEQPCPGSGQGAFTLTFPAGLGDGPHALVASPVDGVGNRGGSVSAT
ncbi:MAG TPA: hypothetical protein VFH51_04545, partial [Myxococcota bacterium]|nr:hypothetical protein [Myxococcota bacterium]